MFVRPIQDFKQNRSVIIFLVVILVPVTLLLSISLTIFIGNTILPFPSGEYKEILNVKEVSSRQLFNDTVSCFRRNWLAYRVVDNNSIQVRSSVFRKSVMQCWGNLNKAKWSTSHPDRDWVQSYQHWHGR